MTTKSLAHKGWSLHFSDHLGIYEGRAVLLAPADLAKKPEIRKEIRVTKDHAVSPERTGAQVQGDVQEALLELVNEYEAGNG